MRRVSVLVGLFAACGEEAATPDAMPDAPPRCDRSAPFGTPVAVGGLNTADEETSARLSPDELTVVFARRRTTTPNDLYIATRPSRDVAFEAPTVLATVNSVNGDAWPSLSPDGLLLAFESDRGSGNPHVYTSRRAARTDAFGPPSIALALMDNDSHPYLANARGLYLSVPNANRAGSGMRDIWRAEIDSTGATATPVALVGGVNGADDEIAPALPADELQLFFRRTVGGESDVFVASRSTATDGFGAAAPVPGLSVTGVGEVPTWVSPDGCALYFHSNAPTNVGGSSDAADIYVATRPGA